VFINTLKYLWIYVSFIQLLISLLLDFKQLWLKFKGKRIDPWPSRDSLDFFKRLGVSSFVVGPSHDSSNLFKRLGESSFVVGPSHDSSNLFKRLGESSFVVGPSHDSSSRVFEPQEARGVLIRAEFLLHQYSLRRHYRQIAVLTSRH
jgi:hypothetical protein